MHLTDSQDYPSHVMGGWSYNDPRGGSAEPSIAANPDGWGKLSHNQFGGHTYTLREGRLTTGRCEKSVLVSGMYVLYYICSRINHDIQT